MNLILITIDDMRFDMTGYGTNFKTSLTPFLDSLVKSQEGLGYIYAFSTGNATPYSFPGIMASTYISFYRKRILGVKNVPSTFFETLKQYGYITIGFNGGNIYVSNVYG